MMKFVVVGMRHTNNYERGDVERNDVLVLIKQPTNKINAQAVAVYYNKPGVSLEDRHVGYIRDQDLDRFHEQHPYGEVYCIVTGVKEYYLLVETETKYIPAGSKPFIDTSGGGLSVNKTKVSDDDLDAAAYLSIKSTDISNYQCFTNPCGEILLGKSVTCNLNEPKQEDKMNTNSIKDSFFREVKNVAFDLQSGKLGVTSKDGISVYDNGTISVNPLVEMSFAMPAFAMRVPVADLKEGDILIGSGDPVFFKSALKEGGYETVSLSGTVQTVGNVTNLFFGKNSVLAVKNMFGSDAGGQMNPMLMMAMSGMLGDSKESKLDPMILAMLMGGMGGFRRYGRYESYAVSNDDEEIIVRPLN